jgi:hypothetical protein
MDNTPGTDRFEAKVARWKPVTVSVILLIAMAGLIAVENRLPLLKLHKAFPTFSNEITFLLSFIGLLLASTASICARNHPFFIVDQNGITDNGVFSKGFGLIRWKNVESISKLQERNGEFVIVKVNNFDELIGRRNIFLRPLLAFQSALTTMCGLGQVSLALSYSNVRADTALQKISEYYQKGTGIGAANLIARASIIRHIAVSFVLAFMIIGTAIGGYLLWQTIRDPHLEILGDEGDRPGGMEISLGNRVWLQKYVVQNTGRESTGLRISLSGTALDSKLLRNPVVLVQYDEQSKNGVTSVRELLPLSQQKDDVWTVTSKQALLVHQDDLFAESLHSLLDGKLLPARLSGPIGWWSDPLGPSVEVSLFGDVTRSGTGNLNFNVVPLDFPASAENLSTQVTAHKVSYSANGELPSVGIPSDFPISAYPQSQIRWLSKEEIKLDCPAAASVVAAFYSSQLRQKGWKTVVQEDKVGMQIVVVADKGKQRIEFQLANLPQHTPAWIHFTNTNLPVRTMDGKLIKVNS